MTRTIALVVGAALFGCSADTPEPTAPAPAAAPPLTPRPAAPEMPLNDTGIIIAGNHPRTLSDTCHGLIDPADPWLMGEIFSSMELPGQDCHHGRDRTAADAADGHAGFSFTKLGADGEPLSAEASVWACVRDEVTGLIWQSLAPADEVVGNAGLNDSDDRFTWYSTDSRHNAGNIGDWNRDYPDCAGYREAEPTTFCNTQALAERINAAGLCGYRDWRLPTATELTGLVNYYRIEPAIDVNYFPATRAANYWTVDSLASNLDAARTVSFGFGATGIALKTAQLHVRLVRGGEHAQD